MGFASLFEVWVQPILRDWKIFVPAVGFYLGCQYACTKLLPKFIGNKKIYDKIPQKDKEDMIIRGCSIVNGIIMTGSAAVFLANLSKHRFVFPEGFYDPIPYYSFFRTTIVAYFAWDIFTCFYYNWSTAFKIHGVFSFLGTYVLMFPYSEQFSGYYSGCFELSNAPLHVSIILRMLESQVGDAVEELEKENSKDTVALQKLQDRKAKLGGYAAVSEYVFAGMYFLVRVVGGTYVTGTWLSRTIPLFLHDVQLRFANPNQESFALHDEGAAGIAILAITVIQLLQYVWFSEIVKRGLGLTGGEEEKKEKTA